MQKEVEREEIRFAIHIPKNDYREDTHYVKKQIFYKDGTSEPKCFLVRDYLRPIWVTKQAHRNYKDKKEFSPREHLMEQKTTQSDINRTVAGLLGNPGLANNPNELKSSPYLYGYDQTSSSLIKLSSLKKNDFIQSAYSVSAFDIETDVDTLEILMATVAKWGDNPGDPAVVHSSILRRYLGDISIKDFKERLQKAIEKYLPEYANLKWEVRVFDSEPELLVDVFKVANEWACDFMAIWNVNFDIPRILDRLKVHNVNPIDVISDMNVPRKYRMCRYKQGPTKKVTASGIVKPINPSLQWHKFLSTTTFYVIDPMCVYRQLRMAGQEEPSYSLDAILTKELKKRKLTFKEADHLKEANWHRFMQSTYPVEYTVYNFFDCLGMLELDEKTKDLSNSLPSFASMTDFANFNSNPKKIVDALFLFGLEKGKVVGTVGDTRKQEEQAEADLVSDELLESEEGEDFDDDEEESNDPKDYKGLGLKGWIQMLRQNYLVNDGLKILKEYPNVSTNARGMVFDVDATAAYPTATMVANVSKETNVNEPISIEGKSEEVFREQNLSLCLGGVNMLEYHSVMYSLPSIDQIDHYLQDVPSFVND